MLSKKIELHHVLIIWVCDVFVSTSLLQVIIFVKSVQRCIALSQLLTDQNFPAICIHRSMPQEERFVFSSSFFSPVWDDHIGSELICSCVERVVLLFYGDQVHFLFLLQPRLVEPFPKSWVQTNDTLYKELVSWISLRDIDRIWIMIITRNNMTFHHTCFGFGRVP